MDDRNATEARAEELAKLSASFYRKCIAEKLPVMAAQLLASTYLSTVMRDEDNRPPPEPWDK